MATCLRVRATRALSAWHGIGPDTFAKTAVKVRRHAANNPRVIVRDLVMHGRSMPGSAGLDQFQLGAAGDDQPGKQRGHAEQRK